MAKKVGLDLFEAAVRGGAVDAKTVHDVAKILGKLNVIRYTAPAERLAEVNRQGRIARDFNADALAVETAAANQVTALRATAARATNRAAVLAGYDLS